MNLPDLKYCPKTVNKNQKKSSGVQEGEYSRVDQCRSPGANSKADRSSSSREDDYGTGIDKTWYLS